jgi:hypothetical protein
MTTILEHMIAIHEQMALAIAAAKADGSGDKLMPIAAAGKTKGKAPKAPKAVRANAGLSTLHGAWTKHVTHAHGTGKTALHPGVGSSDYQAFVATIVASAKAGELLYTDGHAKVKNGKKQVGDVMDEQEAVVGVHTKFVSYWMTEHAAEHAAFKAEWEAANPKESRAASSKNSQASSSDAEGEEGEEGAAKAPKKRGAKKYADMTPEELEAAKAKRAANKAKKTATKAEEEAEERQSACMEPASAPAAIGGGGSVAAAAPAAAEEAEAEEPEVELLPFTYKKVNYLRLGTKDAEGEIEWLETADLWLANPDGSRGAYAGVLLATGKIDNSAETLANAPQLE